MADCLPVFLLVASLAISFANLAIAFAILLERVTRPRRERLPWIDGGR